MNTNAQSLSHMLKQDKTLLSLEIVSFVEISIEILNM